MAELTNRNSPFSPFSVYSVTELRRSPFRGAEIFGGDCGDCEISPLECQAGGNEPLTDSLLTAAMRASDFHGDGPAAREEMRRACLETPQPLRADLLAHFASAYPKGKP